MGNYDHITRELLLKLAEDTKTWHSDRLLKLADLLFPVVKATPENLEKVFDCVKVPETKTSAGVEQ